MFQLPAAAIVAVIVLGAVAQWLAWRLRLPAILLLLVFGFVAGPVAGVLDPDALFGDLLFPLVSLAAAVILFEGGLSASWDEIRKVAGPVRRLVSVGIGITWIGASVAAVVFLNLPVGTSILLGAILVVTGPTVIGPMLQHVRPRGRIGTILKLEGIINDPIGAALAILVFEALLAEQFEHAFGVVASGVIKALVAGGLLGFAGGKLLLLLIRRGLLPPFLKNAGALAVALAAFAAANAVQEESGLLAVTVMGLTLASQRAVDIKPISEFNEHLRVVLISALFIVLAARVDPALLTALPLGMIGFVGAVIGIVRPAAVWLSTLGSPLTWRERLFLSAIAPRGIVAAAIASVFGLRLAALGWGVEAPRVTAATFLVVASTAALSVLSAPLARALGLRQRDPQGVLFLGADLVAREIAKPVRDAGFKVVLVDTNSAHVRQARLEGLTAVSGSLLSQPVLRRIDLDGIGKLIALTPNDEANSLAVVHFRDLFAEHVYQARPALERRVAGGNYPLHLRGSFIGEDATYADLAERLYRGGTVEVTRLTEDFDYADFRRRHRERAIPVLWITRANGLRVIGNGAYEPGPGDRLITVVSPGAGTP